MLDGIVLNRMMEDLFNYKSLSQLSNSSSNSFDAEKINSEHLEKRFEQKPKTSLKKLLTIGSLCALIAGSAYYGIREHNFQKRVDKRVEDIVKIYNNQDETASDLIEKVASTFNYDPIIPQIMRLQESNGDSLAESKKKAIGEMQLTPIAYTEIWNVLNNNYHDRYKQIRKDNPEFVKLLKDKMVPTYDLTLHKKILKLENRKLKNKKLNKGLSEKDSVSLAYYKKIVSNDIMKNYSTMSRKRNILIGSAYYALCRYEMCDEFKVIGPRLDSLSVAAYNAGINAVIKHKGVPGFPETEYYVSVVMKAYHVLTDTSSSEFRVANSLKVKGVQEALSGNRSVQN
ncbi:MAG: lytic transglycosylase domain-containing protein [Candidatus Woesearchaeota archaeon]